MIWLYLGGALASAFVVSALNLFDDLKNDEWNREIYWMMFLVWPLLVPVVLLLAASWAGQQLRVKLRRNK